MTERFTAAVLREGCCYGWVWPEPDGTWTGSKTGPFDTKRWGFLSRSSAEAWVLTNLTVETVAGGTA